MPPAITPTCRDKIVQFEIGSRAYYDKIACHPVWPGGSSGVTIGIGYDLGRHTANEFTTDWGAAGLDSACEALASVCGISGNNAKWVLHTVEKLTIPYDAAVDVFDRVILPRYIAMTVKALPKAADLPPDAFGALVDLVYNRGPGMSPTDDRRREMRLIKTALDAGNVAAVPDYLRAMKRLWPNSKGLLARREWEATTFEQAIGSVVVQPAAPASPPKPRKPMPAPDHVADDNNVSDMLNEAELERVRGINHE